MGVIYNYYVHACMPILSMGVFDFQVPPPDDSRLEEHVETETKLTVC